MAHLAQVVEVLQRGRAAQVEPVADAARGEVGRVQVVELARLARVRPEAEGVHPLRGAEAVERVQVGVEVVAVVAEVRVAARPLGGRGRGAARRRQRALRARLVAHAVEGDDLRLHTVTASITYGYSLYQIWLQLLSHVVTASIT